MTRALSSEAQVTQLTNWVDAGGNLIASRPDPKLAGLLGLGASTGTLSNAYLRVDTTTGAGSGIVGETLGPLTSRWRIGPGTIHRVVTHVTEGGATQITSQQIDAAVSQHLERKLGAVPAKS